MRLVEYENIIKSKVKTDPSDDTLYSDLQSMIMIFLKRKKACRSYQDYEDVSYIIAGDILMKILAKEKIAYYLGYLEKIYRRYVISYYQENSPETVSYEDEDFEKTLVYAKSIDDYNYVENKIYLSDVDKIISQIMSQSCKYSPDTVATLNLNLSLLLSLIRGECVSYHLLPDQEFYLSMITTNFYRKIYNDVMVTKYNG